MVTTTDVLVADVMTIDPVVVAVDATLEEAAELIHLYAISGLPVVDAAGALVGVISKTDLLGVSTVVGRSVRSRPTGLRVGELMTAPALTVSMTATMDEAARLMIRDHVHRLVAVDEEGEPVGVLSSMDFVALYANA
jgi:CBS domain-containing protein